jgi:D-serine dehydratase
MDPSMSHAIETPLHRIRNRTPFLWRNPNRLSTDSLPPDFPLSLDDVLDAEARLRRFAPLLASLFPELAASNGRIESDLIPVPRLAERFKTDDGLNIPGTLMVKGDHALPVAGSVKARGGIYAVLEYAETVAFEAGLIQHESDDYTRLGTEQARAVFGRRRLTVGSTGNLGLSIGIVGSALGFAVSVHMSTEAKKWKKDLLRERGVDVVTHGADYTAACAAVRKASADDPRAHFIDDENSPALFLGYAVSALRLKDQLIDAGLAIGPDRPLFLYLPCGVGGAPGGIAFGARMVFGDSVHPFFAEPVAAPCVALGMITGKHGDISIYDIGLDLKTDADGLAVSRASRFAGMIMAPLLSGIFTVPDDDLYHYLLLLHETEGIDVEPSAAAGFAGPAMLLDTPAGQHYIEENGLTAVMPAAVHVPWATGGLFVPADRHAAFRRKAAALSGRLPPSSIE